MTIRQKTWLFISIVLIISSVGIAVLTHYLYERFYIEQQHDLLIARGKLLEELYFEVDKESFLNRVIWMDRCAEANVFYTEYMEELLTTNNVREKVLISKEEAELLYHGESINIVEGQLLKEDPIIGVAVPIIEEDNQFTGVIFLYRELVEFFEPLYSIKHWLIGAIAVIIMFIVFTVKNIMNRITKPLEDMKIISEKMADGDFTQRIEVKSDDEIGSLSNSFNILVENLENEDLKKREFLSNVSHELRTPLSYIKGYAEAIRDDVVDPKKYINIIYNEADRMQRLVNDLLDLTQLEGDSYPIKMQPLPFAQIFEDVIERFEYAAKQKNIRIVKDLDYNCIVFGDKDRLEQVFENLLDNALRHTEKGEIRVTLKEDKNRIRCTIKDDGVGMPKEAIPKLMERFYRIDKGRSRKEGGTGLGLSIVGQILKKHHAKISFDSMENKGTTVEIIFPKHEDGEVV